MLKLKKSIDPKVLEKYGFELGQAFVDRGERCICNEYDYKDYWKFAMDLDEPSRVSYADEDFDQATASIHIQSNFGNRLWIEFVPCCTYHIEGGDVDVVTDTIHQMALDNILEFVEQEED